VTVRAAFAITLMQVSFALLAGCGESERAKVGTGGSQASGTQPAAERTAAEKSVIGSSLERPAVARAGDAEARANI
jgi:hypothetical protein